MLSQNSIKLLPNLSLLLKKPNTFILVIYLLFFFERVEDGHSYKPFFNSLFHLHICVYMVHPKGHGPWQKPPLYYKSESGKYTLLTLLHVIMHRCYGIFANHKLFCYSSPRNAMSNIVKYIFGSWHFTGFRRLGICDLIQLGTICI